MKKFKGEAVDEKGKKYAGIFEAQDQLSAHKLLEEQGFKQIVIEEISEDDEESPPASRKKEIKLAKPESSPSKVNRGKSEFHATKKKPLGLLKPFLVALVLLIIFPLTIWLVSPEAPTDPPELIAHHFFQYDFNDSFAKQYDLFTEKAKLKLSSLQEYVSKRKRQKNQRYAEYAEKLEAIGERASLNLNPSLGEFVRAYDKPRKVDINTYVTIGPFQEYYLIKLVAEFGQWKIADVRMLSVQDLSVQKEKDESPEENEQYKRMLKVANENKPAFDGVKGVDDMRSKALQLLEDAFEQGKLTRAEYLEKKRKIEMLN